ncbi:MAG: DUF512 domain-containing protein [Fusobacterium necrophorum]|nr:DUF512 domain-containing protein [Fusobacterium necrophorum]
MREKRYELVSQVGMSEPRILHLRNVINSLLQFVNFENKGEIVEIDGFSLKSVEKWLISLPTSEFLPYIESISGECSCKCKFCFEKGNPIPRTIPIQTVRKNITLHEIQYREKYFNPKEKKSLFLVCSAQKEVFCNKEILEIYKYLRQNYPTETLKILTSGIGLTKENVDELEKLKPVVISVSINSSNKNIRKEVMHDQNPEIALSSLKFLKENKIIFVGTIVENELGDEYDEILSTIKYIAKYDPYYIKVYPFGYTRFYEQKEGRKVTYNYKEKYKKIFNFVYALRDKIDIPILVDPLMYKDLEMKNSIEGIVKNSPAYFLGLKMRDKILKINDSDILSNFHAKQILTKYEKEYFANNFKIRENLTIQIERNGTKIKLDLKDIANKLNITEMFPYTSEKYLNNPYELPFGIYLPYPFSFSMLKDIYEIIRGNQSKNPLFITSELMYETFTKTIKRSELFDGISLNIISAENHFWGGNICISDLMTVDDYKKTIENFINHQKLIPDLVIIPSSAFNLWRKDLKGKSIFNLEYELGIKIELLKVVAF